MHPNRRAELVARHIPDEASLFINIGTTTEAVARALLGHSRLKVITNNLNVARILAENEGFEIIIAGGVVRNRDGGVIGEATMDFIRQFRTDFGIIGISGIDADGALLDYDYHEVRVAREIIGHARQVFLVADHTKFGRNAVVRNSVVVGADRYETDEQRAANRAKGLTDLTVGDESLIERAILDKDCRVGRNVRIVNAQGVAEAEGDNYVIRDGIVVIPRGAVVQDGTVI